MQGAEIVSSLCQHQVCVCVCVVYFVFVVCAGLCASVHTCLCVCMSVCACVHACVCVCVCCINEDCGRKMPVIWFSGTLVPTHKTPSWMILVLAWEDLPALSLSHWTCRLQANPHAALNIYKQCRRHIVISRIKYLPFYWRVGYIIRTTTTEVFKLVVRACAWYSWRILVICKQIYYTNFCVWLQPYGFTLQQCISMARL